MKHNSLLPLKKIYHQSISTNFYVKRKLYLFCQLIISDIFTHLFINIDFKSALYDFMPAFYYYSKLPEMFFVYFKVNNNFKDKVKNLFLIFLIF